VFFGLSLAHGRGHLARAVLEGVAFGLRDALELLRGLGLATHDLRISGGGARSALWRQVVADVFNESVAPVEVPEGAAFGAALLAGVGAGVFRDVSAATEVAARRVEPHAPGPLAECYAERYSRFRALYPALRAEFALGAGASAARG
jgi:xylulokinase